MKRLFLALTMLVAMVATASAQAEIKFDKVVHNFGNFSEKSPVQKTTFTFTNVGNKPLVINQAIASWVAPYLLTPSSLSLLVRRVPSPSPTMARACSLVTSRSLSPCAAMATWR